MLYVNVMDTVLCVTLKHQFVRYYISEPMHEVNLNVKFMSCVTDVKKIEDNILIQFCLNSLSVKVQGGHKSQPPTFKVFHSDFLEFRLCSGFFL